LGCRTAPSSPETLHTLDGLAGAVVLGMCNAHFLACGGRLRELGCKTVWVSCMNWLFPAERLLYARVGTFDRHVFQSCYQRDQLVPQLRRWGFSESAGRVIHGVIDAGEFPPAPRPHAAGEAFVVGRISRAEPEKFPRNLWQVYARVPHPLQARVLGWSAAIESRLGPVPSWAECFPAGSLAPAGFLPTLHAMVPGGGEALENWPRVGLEAMAAGVPLVVPAEGGWTEMLRHGQNGYLCSGDDETAYYTARLAYDEPHRLAIARQAREALLDDLAEPAGLTRAWQELLESLASP
jgi:glycosyltransferase involved in cell wall biosynthesis